MKNQTFLHYTPQKVFEEARASIKRNFGLDLTLIELVRLKQYIIPVFKERDKTTTSDSVFNPIEETITRFMVDYCGLPPAVAMVEMADPGKEFSICLKKGFWEISKEFRQYLRRKQEQYHLP